MNANPNNISDEQKVLEYLRSGKVSRSILTVPEKVYKIIWVDPKSANVIKNTHQIDELRGRRIHLEKFESVTDAGIKNCVGLIRGLDGETISVKIDLVKVQMCSNKNTDPVDLVVD